MGFKVTVTVNKMNQEKDLEQLVQSLAEFLRNFTGGNVNVRIDERNTQAPTIDYHTRRKNE
jgi:hypothetical protein